MKTDMIQNMKKNECVVFNMQLSPDYKFTKNQEKLYSFCYEKDLKTLQEGGEVVLKIGKSISVAQRLQSFHNSSPENVCELFQTSFWQIESPDKKERPFVLDLEDFIKILFSNDPRVKHVKGEWYKLSLGVLKFYFDCLKNLPEFIKAGKWPTFYNKLELDPDHLVNKLDKYEIKQEKVITNVETQIKKIREECQKLDPLVEEMEIVCKEKQKFLKKFSEETLALRSLLKFRGNPESEKLENKSFINYDTLFHIGYEIRQMMMNGSQYYGNWSEDVHEDYEHYFLKSLKSVDNMPYDFFEIEEENPEGDKLYYNKAIFAQYSISDVRKKIYQSLTKKNWLAEVKKNVPSNGPSKIKKWILEQEEKRDDER